MKTAELTGRPLNWAVGRAEALHEGLDAPTVLMADYSEDWNYGGPIIHREEICLEIREGGNTRAFWYRMRTNFDGKAKGYGHAFGPTPLIAAMRCYVQAKLGDEVEIPKELQ